MLTSILKRMNMFILLKKLAGMLASFICTRACSRAFFARERAREHARERARERAANKNDPMYFNGTVHTSTCMLASMLASMLV